VKTLCAEAAAVRCDLDSGGRHVAVAEGGF
jgi:hypothetical protein